MATEGAGFEFLCENLATERSTVDKMTADGTSFEWLPENFRNCVVEHNAKDDGGFQAIVRTNAATKEDMAQWLSDFELRTKTKWRVRSTFPCLQRLSYRTDYVCQHSSFNKNHTKRATKNSNCCAKLTQKVNLVTKWTKLDNPHVKDGLPGVIELRNVHNHSLKTTTALQHLPPTAESHQQFEEYFARGMGVAEAMKHHTSVLELRSDVSEALLADGSINPKYSTVRWWYDEWRRCSLGSRTGTAVMKHLVETPPVKTKDITGSDSTAIQMSLQSSPEVADDVAQDTDSSSFRQVIDKMCQLNERFQSTPAATTKILRRLNHIATATQWETFLHTQGAGVSCVYLSVSTIRGQPTALSRCRPDVTRGRKRIAAGRLPLTALERCHQKRQHGRSQNVALNQPNVKQHGRAH